MVEWLELRVEEAHAGRVFAPDEGTRLGSGRVRRVRVRTDDARIEHVREWQRRLNEQGQSFFHGWHYIRQYRPDDINKAVAFRLSECATFEPEGESCGTQYEDRDACVCGVPRRQVGPLRLRARGIPRGVHVAQTIAGEVIVSQMLLAQLASRGLNGIPAGPVFDGARELTEWRQLLTAAGDLEVGRDTEFGIGPFDADIDRQFICPAGCVRGLNLLSELTLAGAGLGRRHVAFTRVSVGVRRGVLVPRPLIVLSPSCRAVLVEGFDRRCRLEVVYPEGLRPSKA